MVKLEELYKVIHIIKEIKLDKNVNGIVIDRDLLLELNKLYEEQFNDIMELNNILIEKNSEIIKLLEENSNLQERIDKAIEYMEESMNNPLKYEWGVLKHTLEILRGDSNE